MVCKQFSGLSMEPVSGLPLGFFLFDCCVSSLVREQVHCGPVLMLAHYISPACASAIVVAQAMSRFGIF